MTMKLPLILLAMFLTVSAILYVHEYHKETDQRLHCWDYQYKCERV